LCAFKFVGFKLNSLIDVPMYFVTTTILYTHHHLNASLFFIFYVFYSNLRFLCYIFPYNNTLDKTSPNKHTVNLWVIMI